MEGAAASYVALYDSALKEPPATREEAAKAMAAFLEEALPSTAHRSWRRAAKELAQMEALDSASYVLDAEARLRSDVDQRLQAAEARVRHYLFQQSASLGQLLENAGGEIRSQEARLKEELGNQILKLGRRLNEDVQAIGAELQHRGDQIRSELEQRLREMGAGQHQEIRSMSSSIEATTSAAVRDAVDASADRLIRHLAERAQRLEAMVERVRAERRDTLPRRLYRRLVPSAIRRPLHALRARIHQAVQR